MKDNDNRFAFLFDPAQYSRRLPTLGSALFIILFGTAFYLINLDSELIKEQISDDFNKQQLILARQAARQTDDFLSRLEREFKGMKWFCENAGEKVRKEALREVFQRNKGMGIIDGGILDSNNKPIEYICACQTLPKDDSDYLGGASFMRPGELVMGPLKIYKEDSSNETRIITTFAAPLVLNNGDRITLFARLDLAALFKNILGDLQSGRTGYSWIINQDGIAFYHPEKAFIGRNIFEARQEKKPYVSFNKINSIMKERMIKGEEGKEKYESWWHSGKKEHIIKLIAFSPVKNLFPGADKVWSIAVVAPTSEVEEIIDTTYIRHLGAQAAIVLGAFLFALLMISYHIKVSSTLEAKVTEKEEYISAILEDSLDGIIFTDKDAKVKVWNKGAERIFGYTAEEMKGHSARRLIPPDMDAEEEMRKVNEAVIKKGHISNYIAPRITKSGKRITCNISRTVMKSENSDILGFTIVIRDETEKVELEQRIYHTEKLASIGNLAAGVAHEINNPLAVILGFTDLLLDNFKEDDPVYKDLKTIETNANNAKKIVQNLLSFARITEGMKDIISVKRCVGIVVNIVKNTLLTQKIDYEVNIPETLSTIKGDAREYQQVIFNLINNSMAAMRKSSKKKLTISAKTVKKTVELAITDTGEGVPDKLKNKIFDPFFTTKKVGEGTGLGLSLCFGIVKKYGGWIKFSSHSYQKGIDKPSGSTFIISMPIKKEKKKKIVNV